MKKRYLIFPVGVFVIWLCASAANTVDNMNTPAVSFVEPHQGQIEYSSAAYGVLEASETFRVRCPANLIIEDVYIEEGDFVTKGTPVMTIYEKSLIKAIDLCDDEEQSSILSDIQNHGYTWIADRDMYITEVCIEEDCSLLEDTLIYKFASNDCISFTAEFEIDEIAVSMFNIGDRLTYTYTKGDEEQERVYLGETEIRSIKNNKVTCLFKDQGALYHGCQVVVSFQYKSKNYNHIIPSSALHQLESSDRYKIYYAVPSEEEERYIVIESEAKILERSNAETAIDFPYSDGRKIIRNISGNIYHGCTVRIGT